MFVTIYEGLEKGSAIIECKRADFLDKYATVRFTTNDPVKTMVEIAKWCNNELKEACLFEIG